MNLKRLTKVKDSDYTVPIGATDEDWLEAEVEHWFYDTSILDERLDESEQSDLYAVSQVISDAIVNHNDVEEHGFTDSPYGDYGHDIYNSVKYFVHKILHGIR